MNNEKIPKVIHYCWFGKNPLPNNIKKYILSWEKKCPDYKIIKWNEENFDVNCNEFVKQAYDNKCWAFVSDYARLKIIYDNGGIYLDTDVELLKNLDFLLDNECFFAQQQNGKKINTGLGFGAKKNSKVLKLLMDDYENRKFEINKKNELACPIINSEVLVKYGYDYSDKKTILNDNLAVIYPAEYFDPFAPGTSQSILTDKTISIHHYSATWTSPRNQLKRKIFNLIGLDKINKIKNILKKEDRI